MHSFWAYWSIFALQIQVHSQESYTIVLNTPIVFREIKVLLCYMLQLHSKKSKYYCIIYYNCIQRNQSIIVLHTTIAFQKSKYHCIAK